MRFLEARTHFGAGGPGKGRDVFGTCTQGVVRRLTVPWATIGLTFGALHSLAVLATPIRAVAGAYNQDCPSLKIEAQLPLNRESSPEFSHRLAIC